MDCQELFFTRHKKNPAHGLGSKILIRISGIFPHLLMRACLRGNKTYGFVNFTFKIDTLLCYVCLEFSLKSLRAVNVLGLFQHR